MKIARFFAIFLEKEENIEDNILTNNENIIDKHYIHWWIFVIPTAIIVFSFYLWIKAIAHGSFNLLSLLDLPITTPKYIPESIYNYLLIGLEYANKYMPQPIHDFLASTKLHPRKWISQIVFIYGAYKLVRATFTFFSTKIILTNERLLVRTGLIKPQYVDIPREHITVFNFKYGILSRFINVGSLIIQSTGGFISIIPAVKEGMEIRRDMIETKDSTNTGNKNSFRNN